MKKKSEKQQPSDPHHKAMRITEILYLKMVTTKQWNVNVSRQVDKTNTECTFSRPATQWEPERPREMLRERIGD